MYFQRKENLFSVLKFRILIAQNFLFHTSNEASGACVRVRVCVRVYVRARVGVCVRARARVSYKSKKYMKVLGKCMAS
jgi:hypothetical protein